MIPDYAVCSYVALSSSGTLHERRFATFATWGVGCSPAIAFRNAAKCPPTSMCVTIVAGWPF